MGDWSLRRVGCSRAIEGVPGLPETLGPAAIPFVVAEVTLQEINPRKLPLKWTIHWSAGRPGSGGHPMTSRPHKVKTDKHKQATVANHRTAVPSIYLHEIFTPETVVVIAYSFPGASI